tara:strand:+ start:13 stop:294 length:282 start_codon:yes stop_codon:yes gene_type:complete
MVKKFKSRYGDERILTLLEDGSYKVEGRTLYTRHGDGLFDFEGGPCYMVGDRLLDVDDEVIIDSITIDQNIVKEDYAAVIITTRKAKRGKSKI